MHTRNSIGSYGILVGQLLQKIRRWLSDFLRGMESRQFLAFNFTIIGSFGDVGKISWCIYGTVFW